MALSKKTKQLMFDNTHGRYSRLTSGDELSLKELLHISDQQEKDLMAYVMSQPEGRFNKLMKVYGRRWREYTEAKLRNRKSMQELANQVEGRCNGH